MRPSIPHAERARAFTLIELLTVIAVISILMALLLPALNMAKNSARKAQAHTDCTNLVVACHAYYNDYGIYPLNSMNGQAGASQPGYAGSDTCYGDPNGSYSSADLCNILRAIADQKYNQNNQLNTRQQIYLEANNVKDQTNPKGGIYGGISNFTGPAGNTIKPGSYVDPWGMEYVIFLDADYDGNVNQAIQWFYYVTPPLVNTGVAACSLGADHTWGAKGNGNFYNSDDIASWQ